MSAANADNLHTLPEYWYHDPTFSNFRRETVAMIYMAQFEGERLRYVPDIWYHDPSL